MNNSDSGPNQDPVEGGYGSPTPEQEMPENASESSVQQIPVDRDSTSSDTEVTPSSEAPIDEDNTDEAKPERESFSSESDADASGETL